MSILVNGIITGLREPPGAAEAKALGLLELCREDVRACLIAKTSLDARKRDQIHFVHTVSVTLDSGEEDVARRFAGRGVVLRQEAPLELCHGTAPMAYRPVIVGFGPAGMFAGLLLARGGYRPLILERGPSMERRVEAVERFWKEGTLNPEANVQFGEGGAGAFSDGKLTTRIGDAKCGWVLRELVRFGAPEEILQKAKPHVGTDLLRGVVTGIRREILSLGGEIRFDTALTDLQGDRAGLRALTTADGEAIPANVLILATGHSARDTFAMLEKRGFDLEAKPFSVGVRIEHLQEDIDRGLYGTLAGHPALPPGEYQLSHRQGERGVYTFCMCPGGVVVPAASEEGMVVTNGMSYHARDGVNANAALAVSVTPGDFGNGALDGVRFQRRLERAAFEAGGGGYRAPAQDVGSFLAGKPGLCMGRVAPSYERGVTEGDFAALLPDFVTEMLKTGLRRFAGKLPGFAAPDALLTGLETRTSSPLRILRGEEYQSPGMPGVYPCAEGAGYAGGIMSAAVDGVRVSMSVMERYAPPK